MFWGEFEGEENYMGLKLARCSSVLSRWFETLDPSASKLVITITVDGDFPAVLCMPLEFRQLQSISTMLCPDALPYRWHKIYRLAGKLYRVGRLR